MSPNRCLWRLTKSITWLALPHQFSTSTTLLRCVGSISVCGLYHFVVFFVIVPGTELFLEQTIKTNVIGTLNMLGLAKRVGARSVFIMFTNYSKASHVENCMRPCFYVQLQNFVDFNL
jgi:hypothetical protein